MISPADGALGLYGAVGDVCAGRALGFARRRANVAARFAQRRGADAAAAWYAGLIAETGLACVATGADDSERRRTLARADYPLHGARLAAAIPGLPRATADLVRWHREHDDGTGFPDALRWDGIPADAAALGIVHAFLAVLADAPDASPAEAAFGLSAEAGRRFGVATLRAFRDYAGATGDDGSAPFEPEANEADAPAPGEDAALGALAAAIDARLPETEGRTERRVALAGPLAAKLGRDPGAAARLARLAALLDVVAAADASGPGAGPQAALADPLDPAGRAARAEHGRAAARIAGAVARYAADAPLLAASVAWHEDGPHDPLAAVVAVALAAEALDPLEAPRRIGAAGGTQFEPETVRAYLASAGAAK